MIIVISESAADDIAEDYRKIVSKFPHAIYYTIEDENIVVQAVADTRRNPVWIQKRFG